MRVGVDSVGFHFSDTVTDYISDAVHSIETKRGHVIDDVLGQAGARAVQHRPTTGVLLQNLKEHFNYPLEGFAHEHLTISLNEFA